MADKQKPGPLNPAVADAAKKLIAEWAYIVDQQRPGLARIAEIKAALRAMLGYRTYEGVTVGKNRRFNPEKFTANYPPETRPELYKQAPDGEKIKEILGEDEYEKYMAEYEPKVTLK